MSWDDIAANGVYSIPGTNSVFLEPCRVISSGYSRFFVLPHLYYCRSVFLSLREGPHTAHDKDLKQHKKQTKKKKKRKLNPLPPNPKELRAQHRHQVIRDFILDAHKAFVVMPEVSSLLKGLEDHLFECKASQFIQDLDWCEIHTEMIDYVKLGNVWQAPLYSITLSEVPEGSTQQNNEPVSSFRLFKHMVQNTADKELIGACAGTMTILPKKGRFLMSDFVDIRQLLSSHKGDGYNLILIDPPWENKSVHRHAIYSTLPNRSLFSVPLKELAHRQGALVGLWVTNREKVRAFVEDELFPAWGVHIQATWFWLKIKSDGQMITELDMLHHKPYECLILGYLPPQGFNINSQLWTQRFLDAQRSQPLKFLPISELSSAFRVIIQGNHHYNCCCLNMRPVRAVFKGWSFLPETFFQVGHHGAMSPFVFSR